MVDTFNFNNVTFVAGPADITAVWSADEDSYLTTSFDQDAHVIYAKQSGETHILNFFTYAMLQQFCLKSMNFTQLCLHIRDYFKLNEDECSEALIANALNSLDEAGLVSMKIKS